jgi:hypothetical protein
MTTITRRTFFELAALNTLASFAPPRSAAQGAMAADLERRIRRIIQTFEEQGFHRTATSVDRDSANWLRDEAQQAGLKASLEAFPHQRVDIQSAVLTVGDRRIDGVPLFDAGFTNEQGVSGRLGPIETDTEIGLAEAIPNTAGAGPLGDARRKNRHRAIVCVTRGGEPGLCPSNADSFLAPFGPPVLQVSSELASWLQEQAQRRVAVHVVAYVRRAPAEAFNVTAMVRGADPALPPLVIMTPRSGWYSCASERGGGLVCWLELMRVVNQATPARDVLFVASSGHELGHLGINAFVDRRPDIVSKSIGWIHLGANIGAARRGNSQVRKADTVSGLPPSGTVPRAGGNTVQSSDDEIERILTHAMTSTGLTVDARTPRERVPGGEAEVVRRGGGRYVSVIGSNTMFHNPADRGPAVIDVRAIAAFVDAFASVARTLVGREPYRS